MVGNTAVNYVLFDNPVAKGVWSFLSSNKSKAGPAVNQQIAAQNANISTAAAEAFPPLWKLMGGNRHILKLAGLSGAAAIMLGAYGSHHHFNVIDDKERDPKTVFEVANRYHVWNSLALLAAPLARKPYLTAVLLSTGIVLFSGTCYYIALTHDRRVSKLTPVGGFMLIFGWLSFIL